MDASPWLQHPGLYLREAARFATAAEDLAATALLQCFLRGVFLYHPALNLIISVQHMWYLASMWCWPCDEVACEQIATLFCNPLHAKEYPYNKLGNVTRALTSFLS